MDQAVLWLPYSSTHPHLYTVRRAKQMLILPAIGSSFPSNTDKFGQIPGGGGHSKERERDTGTAGSREKKAVDAVFLQRGPMVLTDLTIPQGPRNKPVLRRLVKEWCNSSVSTQESPVFRGFAFPPSTWPLFA